tara:strand:+ start:2059 stop:2487 length:429 start_codon:yes stop_codon:yes gene_type:complete
MSKVLYTGGTFDIFHAGHVNFLKMCSKVCEEVIVSLNRDEFIERYKGTPPIFSYKERESCLKSCKYVSEVVENFGDEDSKPAILQAKTNIIAVGNDWCHKDYYKQMSFNQDWLDKNDITLIYLPYTLGVSSSQIIQKIKFSV